MFYLSPKSMHHLAGVHPALCRVIMRAIKITEIDFCVLEGVRTEARQKELYKARKAQTLNSRHITGHAVDLGALIDNTLTWDEEVYIKLAPFVKKAAQEEEVPIEWGGDWKTFKDYVHYQLPWKYYF